MLPRDGATPTHGRTDRRARGPIAVMKENRLAAADANKVRPGGQGRRAALSVA
jgi:hypothetical protein